MNCQQVNGERTHTHVHTYVHRQKDTHEEAKYTHTGIPKHTHTQTKRAAHKYTQTHTHTHDRFGQFHLPLSSHTIEIFVAYFQAICLQLKLPKKKKNGKKIQKSQGKALKIIHPAFLFTKAAPPPRPLTRPFSKKNLDSIYFDALFIICFCSFFSIFCPYHPVWLGFF